MNRPPHQGPPGNQPPPYGPPYGNAPGNAPGGAPGNGPAYDQAVPRQGTTPPIMNAASGPPPGKPAPSQSSPSLLNLKAMRARAMTSSAAWWSYKARQGLLSGGMIASVGLVGLVAAALSDGMICLTGAGLGLIAVGLGVIAWYALAPLTCKWVVVVPKGQFWYVEDARSHKTLAFLGPGTMDIARKVNTALGVYVSFDEIRVRNIVRDVLDTRDLPVDIEVAASLKFDPTTAQGDRYDQLRQLINPTQFQIIIWEEIDGAVRDHMNRLDAVQDSSLQAQIKALTQVVSGRLARLAPMGLVPNRPVLVHIRAPQEVKDRVRSMWGGSADSPMIAEIKALARELNMSYDEAVRTYYFLKHGTEPPPAAYRVPGGGAPAGPAPHTDRERERPRRQPDDPAWDSRRDPWQDSRYTGADAHTMHSSGGGGQRGAPGGHDDPTRFTAPGEWDQEPPSAGPTRVGASPDDPTWIDEEPRAAGPHDETVLRSDPDADEPPPEDDDSQPRRPLRRSDSMPDPFELRRRRRSKDRGPDGA